MSKTETNVGQEGKSINELLKDALADIRKAEGSQWESKIEQGRRLVRIALDYKKRWPNGDAFKSLAVKSKDIPGLFQYRARTLRNLASFATLFDAIKDWLVAEAKKVGRDTQAEPPKTDMTHYLAVDNGRLSVEKKAQLLRLAEKDKWSVAYLKKQVRLELGIESETRDEFDEALEKAVSAISMLTIMVVGNDSLTPKQLTAIWCLNLKIAGYGKAQAEVVPEGMRDSIPTCKAV